MNSGVDAIAMVIESCAPIHTGERRLPMGKSPKAKPKVTVKTKKETTRRLTPKSDVLRQLYLLSGNQCAMPDCDHVIIDGNGVVLGHVCHIRAAMPDGARFDGSMTNEQRREVENLVLMCGGHHTQIDSKSYEETYTLSVVTKIKTDHEGKFKGVGSSLRKAFRDNYADVTDSLVPTKPKTFARLELVLPDCSLEPTDKPARKKQVNALIEKLEIIPPDHLAFILAIIRRAIKLKVDDTILVHVDDAAAALSISPQNLKKLGDALERYDIGGIDLFGTDRGTDEYHVWIRQPSDYLTWQNISAFCHKENIKFEDFVLKLRFAALDC